MVFFDNEKSRVNSAIFFSATLFARLLWVWVACAFVFSVHPEVYVFTEFYNQKRMIQLALILSVTVFSLLPSFRVFVTSLLCLRPFQINAALMGATIFFGLLSLTNTEYVSIGFQEWLSLPVFTCFVIFLAALAQMDEGGLFLFVGGLGATFFLYLFKFLTTLLAAVHTGNLIEPNLMLSGVVNVNFAAQPIGLLIPAAAVLSQSILFRFNRSLGYFCLVTAFILMFVIDNRGVPASILCVLLGSVFILKNRMLMVLPIVISFFIACAVYFLISLYSGIDSLDGQLANISSSSNRLDMWFEIVQALPSHFFVGLGPYSYPFENQHGMFSHPHNFYMQFVSEWGVPAFILLSVIFFKLFFSGVRYIKRRPDDLLFIGCFFGLLEGVVHTGLSGVVIMPVSQTLFLVMLAVCVHRVYASREEKFIATQRQNILGSVFCGLGVVCVVALTFLAVKNSPWREENCVANRGPRFWADGGVLPCDHPFFDDIPYDWEAWRRSKRFD